MPPAAQLLGPDEPGPWELVNREGGSELVLVCDHAANRVPLRLANLGLDKPQLASHIGWDLGVARLARRLSARLDAPLVMSCYSRLVIDCNRPPGHPESIPASVGDIAIPGNRVVSQAQAQQRRQALFDPYQQAIANLLDSRGDRATHLLSMHSFTPSLAGIERPWLLGVCYRQHADWAGRWLEALRAQTEELIGDNEPYQVEAGIDFTLPVQGERRGIPSIMLEVRQDALGDDAGVEHWSEMIGRAWLAVREAEDQ